MSETIKKNKSLWVVIGILGILAIAGVTVAYSGGTPKVVVEGDYIESAGNFEAGGDDMFGASGTRFPHGISADSTSPSSGEVRGSTLTVTGNAALGDASTDSHTITGSASITGTTTLQEVILGSRFNRALTFTAGATTTPGGLLSWNNTGADKICDGFYVNILADSNGTASGLFNVVFGTSTAADNTVGNGGGTLIASTTVATTTGYFMNDEDEGNGPGAFLWTTGTYIIGKIFVETTEGWGALASSSLYTTRSGEAYIRCHSL